MIEITQRIRRSVLVRDFRNQTVPKGQLSFIPRGKLFRRASRSAITILSIRDRNGMLVDLKAFATDPNIELVANQPLLAGERSIQALRLKHGCCVRLRSGGPWQISFLSDPESGSVFIASDNSWVEVNLRSSTKKIVEMTLPDSMREIKKRGRVRKHSARVAAARATYRERVERLIDSTFDAAADDRLARVLAISTPRWRGVTSSTRHLFDRHLPFPLDIEDHPDYVQGWQIDAVAEALKRHSVDTVVISGGDPMLYDLLSAIKAQRPDIRFRLLWHGSFLQLGEDHDWRLLSIWLEAARRGEIACIGTVKKGLDTLITGMGIPAVHVQNRIEFNSDEVRLTPVRDRIGIWLSGSSEYRKQPHNAICAFCSLPELTLTGAGLDPTAIDLVKRLRIRHGEISATPLPHDKLHDAIRSTALTLYVTISECMPMLPLESIALGVPCLIGPSCELFRDDEVLRDIYVVNEPGSPSHIANKLLRALQVQDQTFPRLRSYMTAFNLRSKESVNRFLECQ